MDLDQNAITLIEVAEAILTSLSRENDPDKVYTLVTAITIHAEMRLNAEPADSQLSPFLLNTVRSLLRITRDNALRAITAEGDEAKKEALFAIEEPARLLKNVAVLDQMHAARVFGLLPDPLEEETEDHSDRVMQIFMRFAFGFIRVGSDEDRELQELIIDLPEETRTYVHAWIRRHSASH